MKTIDILEAKYREQNPHRAGHPISTVELLPLLCEHLDAVLVRRDMIHGAGKVEVRKVPDAYADGLEPRISAKSRGKK